MIGLDWEPLYSTSGRRGAKIESLFGCLGAFTESAASAGVKFSDCLAFPPQLGRGALRCIVTPRLLTACGRLSNSPIDG